MLSTHRRFKYAGSTRTGGHREYPDCTARSAWVGLTGACLVRQERAVFRQVDSSLIATTLIYEISSEPSGLDPATCFGASEVQCVPALFEALLSRDPETLEPRAGPGDALSSRRGPDGVHVFPARASESQRDETARRRRRTGTRRSWSDGRPVTADDFVCAWRRLADPALNGGNYAASLYPVANGKEITEGKARPETLGVRADDHFTLRVSLKAPAAHFLEGWRAGRSGRGSAPRNSAADRPGPQRAGCLPVALSPSRMEAIRPYRASEEPALL